MQVFPCPFCGPRPETEFQFAAEAGKARPEGETSERVWADYLYAERNPRGATREIWVHQTCGDFFVMERDTLTHAVASSSSLREGA